MTWFTNSAKWSQMAEDDFNSQWSRKETQERILALKRTTDAVFQGQDKPENDRKKKAFRDFMSDAHLGLRPLWWEICDDTYDWWRTRFVNRKFMNGAKKLESDGTLHTPVYDYENES